ncbi:LytR/AlgR family response regulator transcription factor [Mucilaginibacter lappiensis]|uniref:DNA-binding LytR/AlgR family response regulator n=1 Tax=Mucilaginibacter lappiensis TaxID=354630 RepID=A0A1N7C6E6_9SPHI|nr:LytTR family DNA-binding domain-containing protein [Mucilaginibacter lappiensis]MBB6110980.1 DNA-binding LytR/AlgR family response regulator [Mucilaginibacter lappiensis]MBB6127977.1 DNA-binding LytR/AlgR family response regulator [Mucilaginibacter lappiensis]SIR59024.1 two component transcriptional regulator, LytTR family [Mucilaginibacter lappiensis]
MKIRTLIVDDEPHAIVVLEKYLAQFNQMELVGKCADAIQAFQLLQQKPVDLMFLDIKMPGIKGTDLLRSLKNPPKVIFTTAYSEYALEGFELNAVDYLLKPISFERFLRAIDKIYQLAESKPRPVIIHETPVSDHEAFIYLKVERKTIKVNVNDILWIESLRDYVKVVIKDQVYITRQKISILEEMLPENKFVRIHRSFIVALGKIDSFYSYSIEVAGHELPIGRNYKQDVQKKLKAEQIQFD